MTEKEKNDVKEMVETAKYLADNDPQGLFLAKSNMDILKARCDLDNVSRESNETG